MIKFLLLVSVLMVLHTTSADSPGDQDKMLGAKLTKATTDFSQRLYQKIALGKENAVYSPYSIHSALSMTSTGANGETLTQMRKILGLATLGEDTSAAYHDLIHQLNSADKVKLNTANAIFLNPNVKFQTTFVEEVRDQFMAEVTTFDFNAKEGPEKMVNDFVEDKTEGLIKDIMDPGSITSATLSVLVNTIFFNGTWLAPFSEFRTKKQDFLQVGGSKKQVDMMNDNEARFPYKRDTARKADVLEMPFKGNRFSLAIVLPHETEGIGALEKTLTDLGIDDLFRDLKVTRLRVSVPKFKIETKLHLSRTLVEMGMGKAFSPFLADFSGISKAGQFYIDEVIHQAVIEVKETGTVAAAATVVAVGRTALISPKNKFVADHPFIFFLRDTQTGQVLFQGKYSA